MNEPTFKKLYYLCVQKLTNFPYIEENFDALTNYELLCKVVEELNKMIDNMNTQNESIIALYNAFNTIKNYVDNYFENLDVQEEINNKLDKMVGDGTITNLIKAYIDPLYQNFETQITNEVTSFENSVNNTITGIQSEVESIASGSPAGVYDTLVDLQTDDPSHDNIYLVLSDGNWYYYNTTDSEWASGGVYQGTSVNPDDPIITSINKDLELLDDVMYFKNLFDNATTNGNVTSGGNVTSAEGNVRTDYNKCESETEYTISWNSNTTSFPTKVAYFAADKTYISQQNTGTKLSDITITTPANAKYFIPVWMGASLANITQVKIELGDTKTPYVPHQYYVKNERIEGLSTLQNEINEINNEIFTLPDYYNNEFETISSEVLNNISLDDVVIGLYTDIHFTSKQGTEYQPNIREINAMRKLSDKLPLNFTLDGGDIMTYSTYDFSLETINKTMNTFSGSRCPHFVAKGDHDSAQIDTQISDTEFATLTYPYMPNIVRCPNKLNNYYYDIPNLKKRFICINSGTSMTGQAHDLEPVYTWLLNDVFTDDVKNDWEFIIFGHAPFDYEWNVGMVRKGTFTGVRQTQIMMIDLANAINTAGEFIKNSTQAYQKTFYYDEYGVLTQNTSGTAVSILMGSLNTSYYKNFSGWTSKVKCLISGHCHCDRLNKLTNGIQYDFGIAYTASAQIGGLKDESTYYYPCFGEEGKIAYWHDINNRVAGTISEALMDIYIINSNSIKKLRFGAGSNLSLTL